MDDMWLVQRILDTPHLAADDTIALHIPPLKLGSRSFMLAVDANENSLVKSRQNRQCAAGTGYYGL
eukprot:scaffold434204_cov47-Prasinocladus_malaysianus.AAC.1